MSKRLFVITMLAALALTAPFAVAQEEATKGPRLTLVDPLKATVFASAARSAPAALRSRRRRPPTQRRTRQGTMCSWSLQGVGAKRGKRTTISCARQVQALVRRRPVIPGRSTGRVLDAEPYGGGDKPHRSGRYRLYKWINDPWRYEPAEHASDDSAESQPGKGAAKWNPSEEKPTGEGCADRAEGGANATRKQVDAGLGEKWQSFREGEDHGNRGSPGEAPERSASGRQARRYANDAGWTI